MIKSQSGANFAERTAKIRKNELKYAKLSIKTFTSVRHSTFKI